MPQLERKSRAYTREWGFNSIDLSPRRDQRRINPHMTRSLTPRWISHRQIFSYFAPLGHSCSSKVKSLSVPPSPPSQHLAFLFPSFSPSLSAPFLSLPLALSLALPVALFGNQLAPLLRGAYRAKTTRSWDRLGLARPRRRNALVRLERFLPERVLSVTACIRQCVNLWSLLPRVSRKLSGRHLGAPERACTRERANGIAPP